MHLEDVHSPEDIRGLSYEEADALAAEIRNELIQTVAHRGGHLASNLGAVELTMALHRVFDTPKDQLVFDVGHQSYVHKLLTGRYHQFRTLRSFGGLGGFPKRGESPYDAFDTGHASTALSAALGLARARDMLGQKHHVIAVVGDGALTGGMCYEALNDAGNGISRLVVILNDNEMSIAPNVGALSRHLTNLRMSKKWRSAKKNI
ncbi:MAG: 1-deoxy-D-xylulose-5-phosphate synthase, partial [Clostridia bacterium]|nr:1-deoxy-D-xylulose-5-phosphate synthase [Clostridia bacterium]